MKMTNNAPLYWYVFYNDQLLLQKKAGGYAIPFMNEAPVTVTRSLPVEMQDGTMAMAALPMYLWLRRTFTCRWGSGPLTIISTATFMTRQGRRTRLFIGISTAGFVLSAERRRN